MSQKKSYMSRENLLKEGFFSKIYWLFTKGGKKKFLKALKNDPELKRRKKDAKKAFDTLYSKRASAKKATNKWLKSKGVKPIV